MSQPKLTITINNGGLAQKSPDENNFSGLLFYNTLMPSSGWTASGNTVQIGSIFEAEKNYGITETLFPVEHFQISEFLTVAPSSNLYVGIYPTGTTFTEIKTMQNIAGGKLRRVGIQVQNLSVSAVTTHLTSIQNVLTDCYTAEKPLYAIFAPNSWNFDLSAMTSLRDNANANNVNVFLGQDATGKGFELASSLTYSVTALGRYLGYESTKSVNENTGWVAKFNFQNSSENNNVYVGKHLFNNIEQSNLNTLNDKGYSYLYKTVDYAGTFLNDQPSAAPLTGNDFAYLPNTGTMFKAIRGIRTNLKPFVNSPLLVENNGFIEINTVKSMENAAGKTLEDMKDLKEISNYKVFINPDQDVINTSTVEVNIAILPTATARWINVKIGFVATI